MFGKTGARLKVFREKNILKKNYVQKIKEKKAAFTRSVSCMQTRKVITMSQLRRWNRLKREIPAPVPHALNR